LAEVKAQEDYRNNRTEELKRKSQEGGVVQQNKAKNELAQHLAEEYVSYFNLIKNIKHYNN